jgi:hypothetical protein
MDEQYSIAVRVKRTTVEFAFVRVPVQADVMQTNPDGSPVTDAAGHAHLDGQKVFQRAVEGVEARPAAWYPESQKVEVHPIQRPLEAGEQFS